MLRTRSFQAILLVIFAQASVSFGEDEKHLDQYGDPLPPGAIARLGTVRFRPAGWISAVLISPDLKTIVCSEESGNLSFFDGSTGKLIRAVANTDMHVRHI